MSVTLVNLLCIVLEVVVLAFQGFFFFSRLKTRTVKRFLLLNLFFIGYNILSGYVLTQFSEFPSLIVYGITSVLLVASVGYYCSSYVQSIRNHRSISIPLIASLLFVISLSYVLNGSSNSLQDVIPIAIPLSLIAIVTIYFSRFVKSFDRSVALLSFIMASIGIINFVSFTIYFKDSAIAQTLIVNSLFVVIAFFHHLSLFKKFHRVIHSRGYVPEDAIADKLSRYGLTKRQIEIAQLVLEGYTSKEIAEKCSIAVNTVTSHVCKINDKVGVRNREALRKRFTHNTLAKD